MNSIAKLSYLNIFRKLFVFSKYLLDNLQNKEWKLIWIAIVYILKKKSNKKDIIVTSNLGKFFIRKNTIDFKLANSAYECLVMKSIKGQLVISDLFIDIGANIGTYSIYAAKFGIKSLAFEPVIDNFISLTKNIALNGYEQLITSYNYGLSYKKESSAFNYYSLKPGASSIHELKRKGKKVKVQLEVFDQMKFEELKHAKRTLIKIDVEGMELDVLKGMENMLKSDMAFAIIIETKHTGEEKIRNFLSQHCSFQFLTIDEFNMLAIKNNI